MNRALILSTLVAAAFASNAQAVVINIDDFNSPDVSIVDAAGGGATTVTDAVRTSGYELITGPADGNGSSLTIGSATFPVGLLEVANASGRDSAASVAWAIAAGLIPSNAINVGFFLQVVQSDGNPTSLDFSFNGNPLASFAIAPNTINKGVSFGLTPAQLATIAAGGSLALLINGDTGWDLTIDQFGFSYDVRTVSEPASLGLVGLGLIGVAAFRRRKA